MAEYTLLRLKGELPDITGKVIDPDALLPGAVFAPISLYPWAAAEGNYTPEARAYLFYNENGLHGLLCAREQTIRAVETRFCGDVYLDSCLEAFLTPCPGSNADYVNVEMNAIGTVHLGIGAGRYDRRHPNAVPDGMNPRASGHDGHWWGVSFTLPMDFLRREFGLERLGPGMEMRGNFFACDSSIHTHHGVWNPISTPKPDFHRPELFGLLHFGSETVAFS